MACSQHADILGEEQFEQSETIQGLQERAKVQAGVSATGNFEMYINKTG